MDKKKEDGIDNNYSLEDSASKNKFKNRSRKRKRSNSNSSTDLDDVLPENTLEVERNLHASALKNNLDDISVKKILKKVVTNDHVLALVKLREEEMDSGTEDGLQPITRSKYKELMKVSPSTATWNNLKLSPIKHIPVKTRPEVEALIAQELPDDEDDDEYEPTHDEVPSDDEHALESCSDLESQPRTPATPHTQKTVEPIQDGPFKIPQELTTKSSKEEEATIALRTRSKLSLSSTSIEHIESSFIPPDDIPMPAVDDLWNKFLEECLNPASSNRHEEDDEADPEYNVAADPDANEEDEEGLENSIIKISKKELNDLVTELFNVLPEGSEEQLAGEMGVTDETRDMMDLDKVKATWEGKQEPISDEEMNLTIPVDTYEPRYVGKKEPADVEHETHNVTKNDGESHAPETCIVSTAPGTVQISVVEHVAGVHPLSPRLTPPAPLRHLAQKDAPPTAVSVHVETDIQIHPEQVLILEQQLRQHVQLSTTYFLQLYVHPVHWAHAPKYKEYLESLDKLTRANPRSVANVCNLKPALELVKGWEDSVSENTPENARMVEFIQKEVERSRKRISQNSVHLGDFPDMFKRVVCNSSVFLYPYLLPPCPCRADFTNKKYGYFISEDELMVLGLDQFSKYIEDNPSLYKKPHRVHPRKRWSLSTAAELTCKYMFPWMNVRSLLGHVHLVRRTGDKNNPIVKYFQDGTIVPVKHKLLPFNPSLTLYEQPEFEIPRIWIRYLAKGSKRFKDSLYRKTQTTIQPAGVEVATNVLPQQKNPLPIDFTKPIESGRINVIQRPKKVLTNKLDIPISTQETPTSTVFIAANIFTLVNTSEGTKLIPLRVTTNTVDTTTAPISTPVVLNNLPENSARLKMDDVINNFADTRDQIIEMEKEKQGHCKCCHLLRRICKTRQSLITEYFNSNKKSTKVCACKNRKYPNVTNKLKLLVNSYKSLSVTVYNDLKARIENIKTVSNKKQDIDVNQKDFIDAMKYQIKLIQRANIARDNRMKVKVNNTLSKFSTDEGNPLHLANELHKIFDVELADLYNEFLMFLTPKQADEIDKFKDYFITSCMQDLIMKIEEKLKGNPIHDKLLGELNSFIYSKMTACEMCCHLLEHMHDQPELATYTFELFPHTWRQPDLNNSKFQQTDINLTNINPITVTHQRNDTDMSQPVNNNQQNDTVVTCEETYEIIDYEADDDSTSDEEDAEKTLVEENSSTIKVDKENRKPFSTIKHEINETTDLNITKIEMQDSNSSDMSMLVMSDDEGIKHEPCEWKRDEDKHILEVLKQFLTPEQIQDKTIIEIIEEKHLLTQISENLNKSLNNVRERVLYLLQVLSTEAK